MKPIIDVEGIGDAFAQKLNEAGVKHVETLLERGGTPAGRAELESATGISGANLLKWINRADLDRVRGIGSEFADLLEAAGVDTVPELAQRNAANLAAKLAELNEVKQLVRQAPSESQVERWIEEAKALPRAISY